MKAVKKTSQILGATAERVIVPPSKYERVISMLDAVV
jgi:hypothetical protein